MAKDYLDFIKSSQHFYRSYVQQILSTYGGYAEIEAIAQQFKLDASSLHAPIQLSPTARKDFLLCCHENLIRLGDLSRYRESEVPKRKNLNWGPAMGYYNLAIAIYPASGIPHNQLAIIARIEQNNVGALYHLYQAQGALEPHPTAYRNLGLEFQNILKAQSKDVLVANAGKDSQGLVQKLESSFLLLHAQYFSGVNYPEIDKLENDVLGYLKSKLTEGALETGLVNYLILINIAADFSAGDRWQGDFGLVPPAVFLSLHILRRS